MTLNHFARKEIVRRLGEYVVSYPMDARLAVAFLEAEACEEEKLQRSILGGPNSRALPNIDGRTDVRNRDSAQVESVHESIKVRG